MSGKRCNYVNRPPPWVSDNVTYRAVRLSSGQLKRIIKCGDDNYYMNYNYKDTASYQHDVYSSRYLSELSLLFMSSRWKRCFGPIRSSLSYHETRAEFPPISISFALDQWKNSGLTEKKAPRGCVILSTFWGNLVDNLLCLYSDCVTDGWATL